MRYSLKGEKAMLRIRIEGWDVDADPGKNLNADPMASQVIV
jgi:hypothetical protein